MGRGMPLRKRRRNKQTITITTTEEEMMRIRETSGTFVARWWIEEAKEYYSCSICQCYILRQCR